MRLTIRAHGVSLDGETREYATRRAGSALTRFAARLGRVSLKLADANGPRGGSDDKVCRLSVVVTGRREVLIEERHQSLRAAIDVACERAARAVARELGRGSQAACGHEERTPIGQARHDLGSARAAPAHVAHQGA
jgi:ribosome-associated translation inhibitor RaiA